MNTHPSALNETFDARARRLRPRLHRYCAGLVGSVIEAEDVVQEVLLNAHAALERGTMVDEPDRWLFRVAHNAALDHIRRRNREARVMDSSAETETVADPASTAESRQQAAESLRRLMHLPLLQRSAVMLVDVLGLSLAEAGAVLDSTLAGTKAALHRGRQRLATLTELEAPPRPSMAQDEERRLRHYVERFNARDFDAIRQLIAEDVQVDLVAMGRMRGRGEVSNYFGNYERAHDWVLSLGFVEGQPAILVHDPVGDPALPWSLMLVEWRDGQVTLIRDFRYGRYVMDAARIDPAA